MASPGNGWSGIQDAWLDALVGAWRDLLEATGNLVPTLGAAVAVLLAGWLLAVVARAVILRFGTGLDRLVQALWERAGPSHDKPRHAAPRWPLSRMVGVGVFWLIVLFAVMVAAALLNVPGLPDFFARALAFVPLAVFWLLVLVGAFLASGPVANVAAAAARSQGVGNAALAGHVARALLLAFAVVVVVDQLGFDTALLVNVVSIATAAVLGGVAVAFGIGAGPAAANVVAAHHVRRAYRAGQRVRLGGIEGDIEGDILEITRSAVILDTADGRTLVPARLFSEQVSVLLDAPADDD